MHLQSAHPSTASVDVMTPRKGSSTSTSTGALETTRLWRYRLSWLWGREVSSHHHSFNSPTKQPSAALGQLFATGGSRVCTMIDGHATRLWMLTPCVCIYRSLVRDVQAFNVLPNSGPSLLVGV